MKTYLPDIIVKERTKNTCLLVDVLVPSDQSIVKKEVKILWKYKDIEIEISKMCNMKVKTITILIGALGMIQNHMNKKHRRYTGPTTLDTWQTSTYYNSL